MLALLTLMERKDGRSKADVDALGAILGSCGMVAFALTAYFALPRLGGVVAVAAAWVLWLVVAAALFLAVRGLLLRRTARRGAGP
jgi:hypothetical protein